MAVFGGKTSIYNGGGNDASVLNAYYLYPNTVGNVRFVYSGATGNGTGISPRDAYTGLQAWHDAATADNGDIAMVLPLHAEAVTGAGTLAFTKSGLTIQGVGNGRNRPAISWTTGTDAQWTVTGANLQIRNLFLDWSGFNSIVACMSVTAADFWMQNCEINISASNKQPLIGILTAATAARFKFTDNVALGLATTTGATFTGVVQHEVGVDFDISRNYVRCKGTQAFLNATTILGGRMNDNVIHMYTGTKGIALASGTTGCGFNNRFVVPSGTAPVVGAGFSWANNGYTTEGLTIGTPTAGAF